MVLTDRVWAPRVVADCICRTRAAYYCALRYVCHNETAVLVMRETFARTVTANHNHNFSLKLLLEVLAMLLMDLLTVVLDIANVCG